MQAEYKRDLNHNYLILHEEEEVNTDSYQVRMLAGNAISSILPCRVQAMDGQFRVYYEITSWQPVSLMYEHKKLRERDLRLLFEGIVHILEEMTEFLMDPGQLLFQPEFIYLDASGNKVRFCCLPGYGGSLGRQLQDLAEFLLPKIDHKDPAAVSLGYGIYRKVLYGKIQLDELKEELYQSFQPAEEPEKTRPEEAAERAQPVERLWKEDEKEMQDYIFGSRNTEKDKEKKTIPWGGIAGISAGALAVFGLLFAGYTGLIPGFSIEMALVCILVALAGGTLLYSLVSRRKKESAEVFPDRSRQLYKDIGQEYRQAGKEEYQEEPEEEYTVLSSFRGYEDEEQQAEEETMLLCRRKPEQPAVLIGKTPEDLPEIILREPVTVIGKLRKTSDVVLDYPAVSRMHARIKKRDAGYFLSDLHSRNGTLVNQRLLEEGEEYLLKEGDEVKFADIEFIFSGSQTG